MPLDIVLFLSRFSDWAKTLAEVICLLEFNNKLCKWHLKTQQQSFAWRNTYIGISNFSARSKITIISVPNLASDEFGLYTFMVEILH